MSVASPAGAGRLAGRKSPIAVTFLRDTRHGGPASQPADVAAALAAFIAAATSTFEGAIYDVGSPKPPARTSPPWPQTRRRPAPVPVRGLRLKSVSQAAHGQQVLRVGGAASSLPRNPFDDPIGAFGVAGEMITPDPFDQLASGHHMAPAAHQQFQHRELLEAQDQLDAVDTDPVAVHIDTQRASRQHRVPVADPAASTALIWSSRRRSALRSPG